MKSRRVFIDKIGKSVAFSLVAPSLSFLAKASSNLKKQKDHLKQMKIGIIGAENSHTARFGRLFNVEKAFPGVEIKYVWGETDEFATKAAKEGAIPHIVKDPKEMLGKIDALIVDHRHGKFHLQAATPFLESKIPMFIDKPFCYRLEEGKAFMKLAEKYQTPITSFSSIAHSYETLDMIEQLKNIGEINYAIAYGPVDLDSVYGGLFYYGVHLVQPLLYLFGDQVIKVRVNKADKNKSSSAIMVFKNGMMATLIFSLNRKREKIFIEADKGMIELNATSERKYPEKCDVDMVNMFRTGEEPRTHASILHGVAVLEALEKSADSDQWEEVLS